MLALILKKKMGATNDFEKDFFNDQFCLLKDNGKFKKKDQCKICE